MNSVFPVALALASLTCLSHPAQAQRRGDDASAYGWVFNYEAGLQTARRTGQPLMVVFRCVP